MTTLLSDIFVDLVGLTDHGMTGGGLSPSRFDEGIGYAWILSRSCNE
jgi:hypothetical protein